jgi:hypothetical protein
MLTSQRSFLLLSLSLSAVSACATDAGSGLIDFSEPAATVAKADAIGIDFEPVLAEVGFERRNDGGRAIITSAESWENYFGTVPPADIDFDTESVVFYGAGLQFTGGFSAEIVGISFDDGSQELVIETRFSSPGPYCPVTMALTTPHSIVKFKTTDPAPVWASNSHEDRQYSCSLTGLERQVQLFESLKKWEEKKATLGNDYSYTREFFSFLNFSFENVFVIEDDVVVERHYWSQAGADLETWSEYGTDVGTHDEGFRVATIDELYEECRDEVLTQDDTENFITLSFDAEGLLQTCQYFPMNCQDDCSFGPSISSVEFN